MDQPTEPAIFIHDVVADKSTIDGNGHVNNVVFVQWMQDVAIKHWESRGGIDLQHREHATWVARSHHIEYLSPAQLDDRITIRTWVANVRRVRSVRRYEFLRASDQQMLARGETDWVFVDVASGRPKSIPAGFMQQFIGENGGNDP